MECTVVVAASVAECALTVPISRAVWGDETLVPPPLLLAAAHNGGFVALGYVAGDPEPAGFVFGFLGIRDFHFRHHSHMLAVREAHRSSGLAKALKEAQRDHCLDQGIEVVGWTMDPLEGRNARFSLGTLGAFAREYHRDFYGAMPDRLNTGLATDRFYVEWPIGHQRTYGRLRGADRPAALEDAEREGIGYLLRAEDERPVGLTVPRGESHLLLGIPRDTQAIKRDDPALASTWRQATRAAFESAFAAGYAAVEFLRAADGHGAYLLVQQPKPREEPAADPGDEVGV